MGGMDVLKIEALGKAYATAEGRVEVLREAVNPDAGVILAHHTQPDEAGIVFSRVKPKLAVYYHFVLLGMPTIPAVTEAEVVDMTRKTYAGPLLVGEDLMSFRIDRDQVVQRPASTP